MCGGRLTRCHGFDHPGGRIPSKLMEKGEMDTKMFGVKHKVDGLQTDNIVTYCILF